MKKVLKPIITIIVAVVLFLGIGILLRYLMFDDVDSYSRLMFHDLYNQDKNIDILFVGSSHVRRGMNPLITDEIFGMNTFNASTAAQRIDGSLAMIKEACRHNDVKQVYLELYYGVIDNGDFENRKDLTSTYLISDYMPYSVDKISLLLNSGSQKHYSNGFILARRNWEQLFDTQYIADLFERKHARTYLDYEWVDQNNNDYYVTKGYYGNDSVIWDGAVWNPYAYGKIDKIKAVKGESDWHSTLQSIIEFCKSKDVELIFYIIPEPEWTLVGKGNYQKYSKTIGNLAAENGIEFYDFNLARPEYFDADDSTMFMDMDHLNTEGAGKFSRLFSEFFTGRLKYEDVFYSTYDEKLMDMEPKVYGLAWPDTVDIENGYDAYIITNREENMEYKIRITSYNTGKEVYSQDFCENTVFEIPGNDHGKVEIRWRTAGETDVHVLEAEY